MEKYAVYGGGKPEKIQFEYEIGEIITVNSVDKMMCKKKEVKGDKLIQYFSKGRVVFD